MANKKKIIRLSFYILILLLVVIQFFKPERNLKGNSYDDISRGYPIPENVSVILKNACYDCHSNKTVYPWYSNIQPFAWWMADHIEDGKKHLNFNEFMTYKAKKQYHKLEEIDETVQEGEMPLSSYTIIHGNAKLDDSQKDILIKWTKDLREEIKIQNNIED